jgi:hypothetical protein
MLDRPDWEDRPRRMLFAMNRFVTRQDYAGLEAEYRTLCRMFANDQRTAEIDSLPFANFQESLDKSLKEAIQVLKSKRRKVPVYAATSQTWTIGRSSLEFTDEDTEISEPEDEYSYTQSDRRSRRPQVRGSRPGLSQAGAVSGD